VRCSDDARRSPGPLLMAAAALLVVGLAAPAQAAPPSYVALGDSYSSGVGTPRTSTTVELPASVYAYPSLIAAARGMR
jgi:hypothetical protein